MSEGRRADNSVEGLVLDLWGDEGGQEASPAPEAPEGGDEAPEARSAGAEAPAAAPEHAGPAVRLAWSAAYGVRAAIAAVAVFIVSAIGLTMVFNPALTLLEAVNLFIAKIGEFIGGIGA